ncbi:sulfur carrier protein ThiS [Rheinheimera pacifica]|uniref:Sulfur carrier protein ThiS n=1 Tax=Rheinheimera pacifica TaxID=173990 RepID=A0A1H6MKL8_9GAMM|nr:sulfur carrier protein ThiS [Rheinheimera pacifica]SEH98139.1 sulfur carrier protein ThiS [Rheinheimera pacifica]
MRILLNDTPIQLATNCTVAELVQQQQLKTEGLAVAINNVVIAKQYWSKHQLQNNAQVQLFQIVTGG